MKARVKGTSMLVECLKLITTEDGSKIMECKYINGPCMGCIETLPAEYLVECDVKQDYNNLRNQAAIAAMQGLLSNETYFNRLCSFFGCSDSPSDKLIEQVNYQAIQFANNLIEELKINNV